MSDTPQPTPAKNILRSVTFWVQLLAIAAALFPPVQAWIAANPVDFVSVLAAVNLIVRFVSSGKVILLTKAGENSGGPSGVASLLGLGVIGMGTAAVALAALPSCSSTGDYPLSATLTYRHPGTGAKAGLTYSPSHK